MAKKKITEAPKEIKLEYWEKSYATKDVKEFLVESNAIEGVYDKPSLKDAHDAWNFAVEFNVDLDKDVLAAVYVLTIHQQLLKRKEPRIAGKVRDCAVWIGGQFKPKEQMESLLDKINSWCKWTSDIMLSKKFKKLSDAEKAEVIKGWHVDFEEIHPFEDGNGRTGRILMNIQMYKAQLPLYIIHEGDEQQEYYQWFRNRQWEKAIRDLI